MSAFDFRVRFRTAEGLPELIPNIGEEFSLWLDYYNMRGRISAIPEEEQIELMVKAGIEAAVVTPPNMRANEYVYKLTKRFPGKLFGFANANALRGTRVAYDTLKKCYEEYGFYGLNLGPYMTGLPMGDAKNYPLYTLTESTGKIAIIHSSLHYLRTNPMDLGNPVHLDQIAMDFPTMKIVMCHAGSGFGLAPLWMAQRHPTIYLEFSALGPKYIDKQVLMGMNGFLKKRILWGSDYPLMEFKQVEEWKNYLKPEVYPLFSRDNALALLATAKPK